MCLFVLIFLLWNLTLVRVENKDNILIRGHLSSEVMRKWAMINDMSLEKVVLYKHVGSMRIISQPFLLTGGPWSIGARPISGDHIHAAISFWIGDKPRLFAEHDREPIEHVDYEHDKPAICQSEVPYAYTKVWPHSGVHTHCDGLIHIHPWSAPTSIRKEGLSVRMALWFEQVGIRYREFPLISLEFPGMDRIDGNQTHRWYASEKKCYKDSEFKVYSQYIDQIWLSHAYASYVVWFGAIGSSPPPAHVEQIANLEKVGVYSFDVEPYPQDCVVNPV